MAEHEAAPQSMPDLRRDFFQVLFLPALLLLVVPVLAWGVAGLGASKLDGLFLESVERSIDGAPDIPAEQKPAVKAFYAENPPSTLCGTSSPELAELRADVCAAGADAWQFFWARRLSLFALGLALLGLLGAVVLGFTVSRFPGRQYALFLGGWVGLTAVSAVEVVVQGALAVWMSYWATALVMNVYVPKLILIVAVAAAFGVWTALRGIFHRVRPAVQVGGEAVPRGDDSPLWRRLNELAARVGTPPPANVVAGIDDNFFVTEGHLVADGPVLSGRTLFVSLPLLRVLTTGEADAVLSHELAHFRGGDTSLSARLGPALLRYDVYLAALSEGAMTLPAFYLLRLFRVVVEFARQRDSREREFRADHAAAQVTSPEDLARALLKVTAYSSHRSAIERQLFEQQQQHAGALGLKQRIASGLSAHAASDGFLEALRLANVPHPYDSHPPLEERLARLGAPLAAKDCAALLQEAPAVTWADQLHTSTAIEDRLWRAYEQRFTDAHERSLAYRYLPASDEERAVVERHFPERSFTDADGGVVRLTHGGLEAVDGSFVAFGDVLSITLDEANFANSLHLHHRAGTPSGPGPTTVNLRKLKAQPREELKQAVAEYWQRDTVARQAAAEVSNGDA